MYNPTLVRALNYLVIILNDMEHSRKLVKITHFHVIFDKPDPEGDAPSEDELEPPIPEEDKHELEEEEGGHANTAFNMNPPITQTNIPSIDYLRINLSFFFSYAFILGPSALPPV